MHLFDIFYVVTKFILPSIGDLYFSKLIYDNTCAYLYDRNISMQIPRYIYYIYLHFAERLNHM